MNDFAFLAALLVVAFALYLLAQQGIRDALAEGAPLWPRLIWFALVECVGIGTFVAGLERDLGFAWVLVGVTYVFGGLLAFRIQSRRTAARLLRSLSK